MTGIRGVGPFIDGVWVYRDDILVTDQKERLQRRVRSSPFVQQPVGVDFGQFKSRVPVQSNEYTSL